jgi:hypothetical protein
VGGDLIYFYSLQLFIVYQASANYSKKLSFISIITVYKYICIYILSGVGSLLPATFSMLCLFLDQNKNYHLEDGFPAISLIIISIDRAYAE